MKSFIFYLAALLFLPSFVSFPARGFAQNALDFDGVDDQIMVANASAAIANGNLSMAFWVYPTNPSPGWPDFDGMAGFRNEVNADFYLLHLSATGVEARFRNSSGTNFDLTYNGVVPNAWNHFVLTYDGVNMVLYHNGAPAGTRTASGTISSTTTSFNIGFLPFSGNNFYLDGRMDDVCLYNKALNQSEVTALYTDCSPDLNDPNLQLCYEFNQGVPGGMNAGITTATDSKGNINGLLSGFAMSGQASNFITYGKNTAVTLNPVANCSYTSPSGLYTWTSSGIYRDTIPNSINCDSFITINLSVNPGVFDTLVPSVCNAYTSPSGQHVWTTTGTYQDTVAGPGGCDTLLTIHLSVLNTFASLTDSSCGPYISPSGNTWSMSGAYADTIPNMAGCDSVLSINLTVTNLDLSVTQAGNSLTSNATGVSYQWVNCDSNYAPIPGATLASFTASSDGSYAVIVSENGCTDTSACILLTPSAVEASLFATRILAIPNPHQDAFRLDLGQAFEEVKVRIADLAGKRIYQGTFANVASMPLRIEAVPGLYFVQVRADGKLATLKVLKVERP